VELVGLVDKAGLLAGLEFVQAANTTLARITVLVNKASLVAEMGDAV
jgi:hypothetical protein